LTKLHPSTVSFYKKVSFPLINILNRNNGQAFRSEFTLEGPQAESTSSLASKVPHADPSKLFPPEKEASSTPKSLQKTNSSSSEQSQQRKIIPLQPSRQSTIYLMSIFRKMQQD